MEYVITKNPNMLVIRGKLVYAQSWLTVVSNTLSRVSIVALYLRVFTKGITRTLSWVVMSYLISFVVAQMIAGGLECRPISALWDKDVVGAKCINFILFFKLSGVMNILADVAIMLLPAYTVWNLHASTARKAGIGLVFLSGSLLVFSIVSGFANR